MKGTFLRAAGVVLCGVIWWSLCFIGQGAGHQLLVLAFLLPGYAALITGAILLAKPIAGLIGDLISNIIMPGERHTRPQPMYSIPEGRMAARDYAGALESYAALAAEHPREIVPHLRMMEIWLGVYRDPAAAQTIRDNALLSIKGKKNRVKFETAARLLMGESPPA